MNADGLNTVKDEIRFFMDKAFQMSFGYAGALAALGAAITFDKIDAVAQSLYTTKWILAGAAVLILDTVYLTVAIACLFAIMKRGYFILLHTGADSENPLNVHRQWEFFVKGASKRLFTSPTVNGLAWNVDNYYMIPLFVLIPMISIAAAAYPWCIDSPPITRAAITTLFAINLIVPGCAAWAARRLDKLCRETIRQGVDKGM